MYLLLLGFIFGCLMALIYKKTEPKKKEYDHLSDHYSVPKDNDDEFGI